MVQIQNADAINAIRDGARLSLSEGFPTNLLPNIQPVLDMTPHFHKKCNVIKSLLDRNTTATGVTIYSVPAGRKFYICAISLCGSINATSDSTNAFISATIDGIATVIYQMSKLTLTTTSVANTTPSLFYPVPIVVDGGTNVTFTSAFTVGGQNISAILYGYEVEENH